MKLLFGFAHVALLCPLLTLAAPVSNVSNELMYLGKPIDSLCLFETVDTHGRADLRACGLHSQKGRHIVGQVNPLIAKGFVGYNYSFNIKGSPNTQGNSYYKKFGTVGGSVIVQMLNHSGGTGVFSSLSLVKRDGDIIKTTLLDGGDRCNGGLVNMQRVGTGTHQRLVYSVNLTAYDFLTLAKDNPRHLKAYDDLASCAVCCVATAVFQRNIGPNTLTHEKLLYVDANAYPQGAGQPSSSPKYQACFDKLLKKYSQKNHGKLNAKQLSQFVRQFNAYC